MHACIAAATAALAGIVSAAPIEARTPGADFGLITLHSGNIDVHLQSVAASDGQLFIGKPTVSSCPESVGAACPVGNTTSFTAGDCTLGMNVEVPGGQQVFVDRSGYIGYTQAHSALVPEGAMTEGFEYTAPSENGAVGSLGGFDWTACPTGEPGVYQIKAVLPELSYIECVGVNLGTATVEGLGAWQYD